MNENIINEVAGTIENAADKNFVELGVVGAAGFVAGMAFQKFVVPVFKSIKDKKQQKKLIDETEKFDEDFDTDFREEN